MRDQRVLVVDHRHRAVRVVYHPGTDRAEQTTFPLTQTPTAHDEHLGVLGQIDQCGDGLTGKHLLVHGQRFTTLGGRSHQGTRIGENPFGFQLLVLEEGGGKRNLNPRLRRSAGQHVGQRQRDAAHGGIAGGPVDRDTGCVRTVHCDNDADGCGLGGHLGASSMRSAARYRRTIRQ